MSIEWLEDKHLHMLACGEDEPKEYAKLSIEFAISVLESIDMSLHLNSEAIYSKRQQKFIEDKIKELKQYLK